MYLFPCHTELILYIVKICDVFDFCKCHFIFEIIRKIFNKTFVLYSLMCLWSHYHNTVAIL